MQNKFVELIKQAGITHYGLLYSLAKKTLEENKKFKETYGDRIFYLNDSKSDIVAKIYEGVKLNPEAVLTESQSTFHCLTEVFQVKEDNKLYSFFFSMEYGENSVFFELESYEKEL